MAVFMGAARVGQSGAMKDAADDLPPFRERGERRWSWRAALPHPLVDQCGDGGQQVGTVLADPAFDVRVFVAVAVDVVGGEAQTNPAATALDVRLPGGVVGRKGKLGFVGQRHGFAHPEAAVLPHARVVGGGFKRRIADVAFHVGQMEEATAGHQRGGDSFPHLVVAFLGERGADDGAAGVGDVGEVGAGVLAAALAVAVEDPERGALPAHQSPAERGDETGKGVDTGLFVVPPEATVFRQAEKIM